MLKCRILIAVFEEKEANSCWYLLLSGRVDLYQQPSSKHPRISESKTRLKTIGAGSIFGELNASKHECSARVVKAIEFVRIPRSHFLQIYDKHADHLQPFITATEDLVSGGSTRLTRFTRLTSSQYIYTNCRYR
jgi:CRP-like cAMP-binding protein